MELKIAVPAVHLMPLRRLRAASEKSSTASTIREGFDVSVTCRTCGQQGRLPCGTGCDPGLGIRNGLCELCGSDSQLPCDAGCNSGLGMKSGLCRLCGGVGQVPCDNGCAGGLALRNGLCSMCGAAGQSACDSGCRSGDATGQWYMCRLRIYESGAVQQRLCPSVEGGRRRLPDMRRQRADTLRRWVQPGTGDKERSLFYESGDNTRELLQHRAEL
jgi:hypothetical protein